MGKTSTISPPNYSGDLSGMMSVNGSPIAVSKDGKTDYIMSDAQKKAYAYAQTAFADNLNSINTFLPETLNKMYSEVQALKNKGTAEINSIYSPMINNLKNDIAKRFGSFNNSDFLDSLNSIENSRANAISTLAQDITAKQSELIQNELSNRYNYLNFLNNYQNQVFNNAMSASTGANENATLKMKYQNALYNALLQQYNTQQQSNSNYASSIIPLMMSML